MAKKDEHVDRFYADNIMILKYRKGKECNANLQLRLSEDIVTLKIANKSIKIFQTNHYGSIVSLSSCFMF